MGIIKFKKNDLLKSSYQYTKITVMLTVSSHITAAGKDCEDEGGCREDRNCEQGPSSLLYWIKQTFVTQSQFLHIIFLTLLNFKFTNLKICGAK